MKFSGIFGLRPSAKYIGASVAALGALAIAAQANAADMYVPSGGGFKDVPVIAPVPVWTGFYAGINMGAAWSDLNFSRNTFYDYNYASTLPVVCSAAAPYCFGGDHVNSTNAFGGGQLGYNWQGWGNFVFGVEVDLEGIAGNNERTFVGKSRLNRFDTIAVRLKEEGGFAGDVTGRLGYTWGNWMLYAKGGFAWFDPHLSASAVALKGGVPVAGVSFNNWDNNNTLTGWTVGGGVEWLLNPNWSVKVEYMYYDFGLNNNNWDAYYNGNYYNSWRLFDHDLTVNTVKLGVNYHLTSGYTPIK